MSKIIIDKLFGEDKSARVGKIFVKIGDQIKAGDGLFNAESAKGNYLVKSEQEGKILVILIVEGQQIKIGDEAIEIDGEKACVKPESVKSAYSFGLAQPKKENICCDLVVVGGGPGGYVAAIRAAQLGADVVLIEKHKIGGTCLNYGCIPTKSLVKSAHLFDEILRSEEFGIHVQHAKIDLGKIVERKDKVVSELSSGIKYLLGKSNIRLIEGEAKTSPEGEIIVKNAKIEAQINAKNIMTLATIEQDKAAGGVARRKIRIKSGDVVTASLYLTGTTSPYRAVLRFKSGLTVQRPIGEFVAESRFEALKAGWKMLREDKKIMESFGWSWVEN